MNGLLKDKIIGKFQELFGDASKTVFSPGRINLIGEHVDYSNGFVFPAAIDKGIIASIGKTEGDMCTTFAYDLNEIVTFSIDDVQPLEDGGWMNYVLGVIHGIQEKGKQILPFNLVFGGDIPEGSGLSSSAALENSVVFALNELFELGLSKEEMILISQKAEHNFVGVKCGIMDQYASMFGIKNHFLFLDCKTTTSTPVQIDLGDFEFLLINTNVKHNLADSAYNNRREVTQNISEKLGVASLRETTLNDLASIKQDVPIKDYNKALFVLEEIQRTQSARDAITNNDISELGRLLFECHEGLKDKFQVSCDELDFLVDLAKNKETAIGARMMGGGFGGCTINMVRKDAINVFINELSEAYKEVFNRECTPIKVKIGDGTKLIK